MVIQLTFKTPDVRDTMEYDIVNARIDGEDEDEQWVREDAARKFVEKYVKYGEYITVEFDTDAKTAKVVEC